MKLPPNDVALLAEWRATLPPLAPDETRVKVSDRALLVLRGSRGTVFRCSLLQPPDKRLGVFGGSARAWDDGTNVRNEERLALLSEAARLLLPEVVLAVFDSSPWNGRTNVIERSVLALILHKELLEHDYPPGGLRFVEVGDVVGEASYEGELNAVFRVSGFSLRANGTWTDHLWEDVEGPLMPPKVDLSVGPVRHTLLQIELKDNQVVGFEVDHFWGYYSLFRSVTRWLLTGSEADWWKRLEARTWRPKQLPPSDSDGS